MNKQLKVAFFIGYFPKISETWFIEQVTSLIDLGVDVQIFAFRHGGPEDVSDAVRSYGLLNRTTYISYPQNFFLRFIRTPWCILRIIAYAPASAYRLLQAVSSEGFGQAWKYLFWTAPLAGEIERYDIVHCHFGMIANKYLRIKDILSISKPLVTTFYGQDSSKYIQSKGQGVYDRLKVENDMLLTMTEEMMERMISFGFPKERVRVHYTGVVLGHYPFVQRQFARGETLKLSFVGRFVEKKGIPDLLRAIDSLKKQYPNVELHIFGGGPDQGFNKEIQNLTNELGLRDCIVFHGIVRNEELHKKLPSMHLMVQLSKTAQNGDTDDLPVAILEAQATGMPVVTTCHVGIPDGVRDGESGFLVEPGDYVAAAQKILYFIEHPELVASMGKNAREFMEERFDLIKIDKMLISLYQELLKKSA